MGQTATDTEMLNALAHLRADFPILSREVNGKPLVYFDNAASAQKPQRVIDAISNYYAHHHSNVHRGVHALSQEATEMYEAARTTAQRFVNSAHSHEVLFVKGTTEAINLVAHGFGRKFINQGDEVLISTMEHHSNIVPWQLMCEERGATLKVIPINDAGELIFEAFEALLNERTALVAVNHVSNALGTINPVKAIIDKAHSLDVPVLLDGAQAAPHMAVDVQALDCDFYALSGHKMFGPTGQGILYGKEKWLEAMNPYQAGGEMIKTVTFEKTTFNELPHKFEAGTPNMAGGIGLAAAIDYVTEIGLDRIAAAENALLDYATEKLQAMNGLRIIGTAASKASVISFLQGSIHPYDTGTILDKLGIAVRTGHHCTEPLMQRFNIPGTVRASFAFYNTSEEVDALVAGLERAAKMLG